MTKNMRFGAPLRLTVGGGAGFLQALRVAAGTAVLAEEIASPATAR